MDRRVCVTWYLEKHSFAKMLSGSDIGFVFPVQSYLPTKLIEKGLVLDVIITYSLEGSNHPSQGEFTSQNKILDIVGDYCIPYDRAERERKFSHAMRYLEKVSVDD